MQQLTCDVLVVGGGTGGTAAAIQAARRGAKTILVSEFPWLGGMLTSAGVTAPDGNELAAWQTGLWGAFLQALRDRQPQGLDHAWVSFFTYEPRVGAAIFADWVNALPNLQWIKEQVPLEVYRQGDRITGVRFAQYQIQAQVTIDGTELGDLLALAQVPHRWSWDWQLSLAEPSAPSEPNQMTQQYPVQAPTWVVVLQAFPNEDAPVIPAPPIDHPEQFVGTWDGYGAEQFMNYGRLPNGCFMMNFPQKGNDYGDRLSRLIASETARRDVHQEAYWHSQSYARFIQTQLGRGYGLAEQTFPRGNYLGGGAFALHPYYRESRRLQGLATVMEPDILPVANGCVATLPTDKTGVVSAIAIGNYANDHHYPGYEFPLHPKSIRWGGRWTGTPFTIPYPALVSETIDGLLVCEKNISVSHIANGSTRLQPLVLGIGQAAGMAAALCVEENCEPRSLSVRKVQEALLNDAIAPAAVVPLFNLTLEHPDWLQWQQYYLDHPEEYPVDGVCPDAKPIDVKPMAARVEATDLELFSGMFVAIAPQQYQLVHEQGGRSVTSDLVTLKDEVNQPMLKLAGSEQVEQVAVNVWGKLNHSGGWIRVERIALCG
jgi:hypothetical protein